MKLKSRYDWMGDPAKDAQSYIQGYLVDSEYGRGQVETLQAELENCREMVSFLAAALLERGVVDLRDLNMLDTEVSGD